MSKFFKFAHNIDTDVIIPSQYVLMPFEEMKQHTFEPLMPDFSRRCEEGDIIIAGDNFGCGSSREQAVHVIKSNGIRAVIAH